MKISNLCIASAVRHGRWRWGLLGVCLSITLPGHAEIRVILGGMPIITLTDMADFRLSAISLFLVIYFVVSYVIYRLWNYLRHDFTSLPELSFRRALAVVLLWGLAFHLLLVMVAGARELMTPEAWEKTGVVHHLSPDMHQHYMDTRQHKIEVLKQELWDYAEAHQGKFPSEEGRSAIPDESWLVPTGQLPYQYISGQSVGSPPTMLAYEPDVYGEERLVLFTNGNIEVLSSRSVRELLQEPEP